MGMLDYSEFGTSKLGFQDQLRDLPQDLIAAMRMRNERAKQEQERTYKNAQIAHQNQELQRLINKDTEDKKTSERQHNFDLQQKVNERLAAGDQEGARALIAASGGTMEAPAAKTAQPDMTLDDLNKTVSSAESDLGLGDLTPPEVNDEAASIVSAPPEKESPPATDLISAMRAREAPPEPEQDASMTRMPSRATQGMELGSEPPAPPAQPPAPRFAYTPPGGQPISVDPEQMRSGERNRTADEFERTQIAQADALFQSASGRPPEVRTAIQAEATQRKADAKRIAAYIRSGVVQPKEAATQEELGIRERAGQAITEKDRFLEEGRNSRTAQMAAAAMARKREGEPPAGEPDPKVESRYQADVAEAKRNSLASADMKEIRTLDKLRRELQNPNGPQHQLAIDNITRLAVGGRAPVQLANNLQNAIGLYQSAENWLYRQAHGGVSMPSVLDQYRKAMNEWNEVSIAQRQADAQAFDEQAGVSSHWFQVPEMRARVLDHGRSYYRQLGLPIPPEYGNPQGTPTVPPAHGRKAPAPQKPATEDDDEAFIKNGR